MSVNQKYWAGISPHVHKSLVRGAAGLLAFGLFLPTGVAAAAPLDPLSTDEIVVEAQAEPQVPADSQVLVHDGVSETDESVTAASDVNEPNNLSAASDGAGEGVPFQDFRLKKCVADYFGREISDAITEADLASISSLNCGFRKIRDISPLAYAVNLKYLVLDQNRLVDLTPLAGLTKLRSLSLSQNRIQDLTMLSGLSDLTSLWLGENRISDVTPLAGLTTLHLLDLSANRISDISPLEELSQLGHVDPDDTWLGLYLTNQQIVLPDVISGEAFALPPVRSVDGSSIPLVVGSGEGIIDGERVTWSIPDGGEASLGWTQVVSLGNAQTDFSGTMTQKVLPNTALKPEPEIHTDHLVLRADNSYMIRYALSSGSYDDVVTHGEPGDVAFFGDWDGDGVDGIAVRRGNTYYVNNVVNSDEAPYEITFGWADDEVLVGDWDGDGVDTLAVRRGNTFFVKNVIANGDADEVFTYGRAEDTAFAGDWDGDGVDTLAVRRGDTYFIKNTILGGYADYESVFGSESDEVLMGDWNDDGVDTPLLRAADRFVVFNDFNDGAPAFEFSLGEGTELAYSARLR